MKKLTALSLATVLTATPALADDTPPSSFSSGLP